MEEFAELRRSISTYIDKYNTPTREENDLLLKRLAELGTQPGGKEKRVYLKTREQIVLSNGGFAMKYVMKYKSVLNDDVSILDLFQEANLGLIEAIDTFDVSLNTSFTTYAYFHIRKRIIDFIKKNKIVRAPRDIARNMKHVNEIKCELYTELQREPLTTELMKGLRERRGISLSEAMVDSIVILLDLNSSGYEESFISEFNEQVSVEEDMNDLFKKMEINLIKELDKLPDKTRQVIKYRFGIGKEYPHTLEEIKYMLKVKKEELP